MVSLISTAAATSSSTVLVPRLPRRSQIDLDLVLIPSLAAGSGGLDLGSEVATLRADQGRENL
jgi:hypothetical protein